MAALSKRDIEMIFRAETDAAQRPVNALSADVKKLRQTLEDLTKGVGKTDASLESLAATTHELEKAQQELGNARTLLTQLNAQQTALDRAEAAADKSVKKYNELKSTIDGAEKPTKRMTASLAAAERGMQANNARVEEARKNYQEVKGSIESIIGPVDSLQGAFRTVAVAQRDITQGLAAAKGSVSAFKTEIADTKVEADRLAQVDAFRKIAADFIAVDSAAVRVKAGLDGGTTAAVRLADAIHGIVNPARATADTLDGVDARLKAVTDKMAGGKISVNEWNHLNNELEGVQASLIRVSAEVDKFTAQQSRVDAAASAYDLQAKKVRELAQAEITASTDVQALTASIQREETALIGLGDVLDRETAKLNAFGGSLKKAGIDSGNLPAAVQRIESTATRAAPAIKKVADAITPGGKKGFLGLDAFQIQNLSFQVNDVFTSLASGISPMQTLAQQGGQIIQIFPGLLSGFVAWLPLIAPIGAALFVLSSALSEANTQLETMRTASTVLTALGNTNGYDTKKFQQIVEDFRNIGVSAEDALTATKIFVTEGLNPAAVDDFVIAAKNLADVQGIDLKTATEDLTKAFTGGATEVLALDDKYHFLTDTQRDNIAASKDTKREHDEVRKAFTQLYNKMQEGANQARGPMTDATNTLRNAWKGLLQTFAETGVIDYAKTAIANLVTGFAYLINVAKRAAGLFKGVGSALASGGPAGILLAGAQLGSNIATQENIFSGAIQDTFRQKQEANAASNRAMSMGNADPGLGSRGRQRDREADAAKARKDAERDRKKGAREAEAEAKRRLAEAKRLAKEYANEQDQLSSALSRFTVEAMRNQQAPLEQQLSLAKSAVEEQFKALEDRLSEFKAKFGPDAKINGMSQAEYAAALEQQKQQIILAKQLGVYESNVNDLLKSRDARLKAIKEQQDAGLLSAQQALDKTKEVTSTMGPQIDAAIASARAFIASLKPSAETSALLDKFALIQSQGSGPQSNQTVVRGAAKAGLSSEEQAVNDIFAQRAALIDAANKLYDLGVISFDEKERRVKAAYESTDGALRKQIESMRAFLEANRELFPPEVYQRAIAQLAEYDTKLQYTSELHKQLKKTAEDSIVNGIMGMFDSLAQGIANVITGAGSLGDVLSGLGRAALSFAADFLKAVAQAIIQIYALKAAKAIIGAFHGGGVVGDYGGGQMTLSRGVGLGAVSLAGVPRYHNGTDGAGLKSNEMLAVLEKGERVQTKEQQRSEKRRLERAKSQSGGGLRQVLAFGDDQVAAAMAGGSGEEVTVTHIRRNIPLIKQLLK
jgi:hypothetical protein